MLMIIILVMDCLKDLLIIINLLLFFFTCRITYQHNRTYFWHESLLRASMSMTLRSRTFHSRWWMWAGSGQSVDDGSSASTVSLLCSSWRHVASLTRFLWRTVRPTGSWSRSTYSTPSSTTVCFLKHPSFFSSIRQTCWRRK